MSISVIVPPLGESVSEATVAKWHKKVGDTVKVDELIVELETDKVTLEVNSPSGGKLAEIIIAEGTSVGVGKELGKIDETAIGASPAAPSATATQINVVTTSPSSPSASPSASPAATKIAADNNINLASITNGTGKDNRITKFDVLSANSNNQAAPVSHGTPAPAAKPQEERVKMTKLRKTIADRLKYSQNTAAILTTFNEVDMSEVFRLRKQHQDQFVEKHGVKLGFMSFFARAAVKALQDIPAVNAEIDGDYIVYKNHYDIGVAVGTDQGLVVPVLRNVNQLSFAQIEKEIVALGKKAKDGKLSMSDMQGATFTITNGGTYGSLLSTPIINPPQSGILGMHNIVERPVAISGQVVIKPMMYLALSYDHRIIDGKEAVTFLVKIKQLIESPEKLLLDL